MYITNPFNFGTMYITFFVVTASIAVNDGFVITPSSVFPSISSNNYHLDNGRQSVQADTRYIKRYNGRSTNNNIVSLNAVKKKRRRRRKKDDGDNNSSSSDTTTSSSNASSVTDIQDLVGVEGLEQENVELSEEDLQTMKEIAEFTFDESITKGIKDDVKQDTDVEAMKVTAGSESTAIPLPDIKDVLKKKKEQKAIDEEEMQREKEKQERKVKRSDREAYKNLLEEIPFADADDTLFVEEEYTTVSALLGERAKPFLGIPLGPLQVGHFIGALGIVLMAYVEYPGFPLTNLPTPLRDALQGGLFTIYTINFILAILSTFKASERGQSKVLWAVKTLSVGGLAYDQLKQLPTLKEIDEIKNRKGARAMKKK